MKSIPRSLLLSAPFIAVLAIASVGFAKDDELGSLALASTAHPEAGALDLGTEQVTPDPAVDFDTSVALAGVTGSGPAATAPKAQASTAWQEVADKR